MHITDPVADMLTRIRNANSAKHDTVDVPASNMKKSIAQILLDEGYIKSFQVEEDGLQGMIHITLKYNAGKERVINGLRRVSKPGLRRYVGADELPRVLRGLGIAIISTSKGVMTDKKARELHVGGKVRVGFEGGQMPLARRIPKRGFNNIFAKPLEIINLGALNAFEDGETVTAEALLEKGILSKCEYGYKVLGNGKVSKKVTVKASAFSASAKEAIEAAGGKAEVM